MMRPWSFSEERRPATMDLMAVSGPMTDRRSSSCSWCPRASQRTENLEAVRRCLPYTSTSNVPISGAGMAHLLYWLFWRGSPEGADLPSGIDRAHHQVDPLG